MCAFGSSTPRAPRGRPNSGWPAGGHHARHAGACSFHIRACATDRSRPRAAREYSDPARGARPARAAGVCSPRLVVTFSLLPLSPPGAAAPLRAGRLAHKSRARWGPSAFTFQDRYSQGLARRVAHGHAASVAATGSRCPCTMALSRVSPGSHVLGARERSRGPHTPLSPRASPGACAGALRGKMSANHLY